MIFLAESIVLLSVNFSMFFFDKLTVTMSTILSADREDSHLMVRALLLMLSDPENYENVISNVKIFKTICQIRLRNIAGIENLRLCIFLHPTHPFSSTPPIDEHFLTDIIRIMLGQWI